MQDATNRTPSEEPIDQDDSAVELYDQQRRAFRAHLGVFAGSMVIIFLINLVINAASGLTTEWSAWWSVIALLGWGIGVAVHGIVLRVARPDGIS